MSAPFPNSEPTYEDLSRPNRAYFVKIGSFIRGLVPSFYQPHESPEDIPVCDENGGILFANVDKRSFSVNEVPIERRWAIREDGRLLPQHDFERKMNLWYDEYYSQIKVDDPSAQVQVGVFKNYYVPAVLTYVSKQPDPADQRRMIPMHYVANRTAGAVPEVLEDAAGNQVSALESIVAAYQNPRLRGTLNPRETKMAVEFLGGGLVQDEATEIAALKAELAALKAAPPKTGKKEKNFAGTAACGRTFKGVTQKAANHYVVLHKKHCVTCGDSDGDTT